MSEMITIDTGSNTLQSENIEPLMIHDDNLPLLHQSIPEFTGQLPNPSVTRLIRQLTLTRKMYAGLGLSANQCNIAERIFVIGTDSFDLTCINPKVIDASPDLQKGREGCLSYPGMYLNVSRASWIVAEFMDENGEVKQMKLDGLTARCYLHELDHMNGITFTEHVGPVALQFAKEKQKKVLKKFERRFKNGVHV